MILMLLSVLKEGASSLCLIASLVSTQGIQTTILSDLLHSSSQAQIQLGPSLGIDLLYSPFPSTKSNYPLAPHLQRSHTTVWVYYIQHIILLKKMWKNLYFFWERLGMERLVYGMGGMPSPPLFDIFYENWMVRSYAIDWSKIDIVSSQHFLITLWSHCESAKFKPTSCSLQVFLRFLKDSLI